MAPRKNNLQGLIANQLYVQKAYFDGMLDCTNSSAEYRQRVTTQPAGPLAGRFRPKKPQK